MGHKNGNNGSGEFEFPDGSKFNFSDAAWPNEPNATPIEDFHALEKFASLGHPVEVFTVSGFLTLGGGIDELLDRRLLSAWVSARSGLLRVFNWDERQIRAEPHWVCLN